MFIICKCNTGTNENVILNCDSIPDIYTRFDRDTITYCDVPLNQSMCTYITFLTNFCALQYNRVLPNTSVITYII